MMQLDARNLYCPEFSLPVRQFLNSVPDNVSAHIVTFEPRASMRMKHICSAYNWSLKEKKEGDTIHFLVKKEST